MHPRPPAAVFASNNNTKCMCGCFWRTFVYLGSPGRPRLLATPRRRLAAQALPLAPTRKLLRNSGVRNPHQGAKTAAPPLSCTGVRRRIVGLHQWSDWCQLPPACWRARNPSTSCSHSALKVRKKERDRGDREPEREKRSAQGGAGRDARTPLLTSTQRGG